MNSVHSIYSVIARYAMAIRTWASAHRLQATVAVMLLLVGGYWTYAKATSTTGDVTYTLGSVSRSTIVSSVSASGQVSASNQVDITSNASGEITSVNATPGRVVQKGAVIARIDAAD